MVIRINQEKRYEICELFPESEEERKLIFALDESLRRMDYQASQISGIDEAILLTLFKSDDDVQLNTNIKAEKANTETSDIYLQREELEREIRYLVNDFAYKSFKQNRVDIKIELSVSYAHNSNVPYPYFYDAHVTFTI